MSGLIEHLGDEIDFFVETRDRDLGSRRPYSLVMDDGWHQIGNARVRYLPPGNVLRTIFRSAARGRYDLLYLNSVFSPSFAVFPLVLRRLGFARPSAVLVAPRGELSPGARGLKAVRKSLYLYSAMKVGLYRGVYWQAATTSEAAQIAHTFGGSMLASGRVVVAPQLMTSSGRERATQQRPIKHPGEARIAFVSRISPMKNLTAALGLLRGLDGDITFDIYGPIEDVGYWRGCQELIRSLQREVAVTYHGEVPHERVADTLRRYHLLLLPTLGESFGHVIARLSL